MLQPLPPPTTKGDDNTTSVREFVQSVLNPVARFVDENLRAVRGCASCSLLLTALFMISKVKGVRAFRSAAAIPPAVFSQRMRIQGKVVSTSAKGWQFHHRPLGGTFLRSLLTFSSNTYVMSQAERSQCITVRPFGVSVGMSANDDMLHRNWAAEHLVQPNRTVCIVPFKIQPNSDVVVGTLEARVGPIRGVTHLLGVKRRVDLAEVLCSQGLARVLVESGGVPGESADNAFHIQDAQRISSLSAAESTAKQAQVGLWAKEDDDDDESSETASTFMLSKLLHMFRRTNM